MRTRLVRLFTLIISICSGGIASAQTGLCPSNLDFEFGDFTNWTCRSGAVSQVGGLNTVNLPTLGPVPGRHTIISAANASTDPYGSFPQICPNGSGYSVKLGNASTGAQAESISYTYTIPSSLSVFSMIFHYAIVLQNPGHAFEAQPRFRARITDLSTNAPIPCVTFDFSANSSLPGFLVSPVVASPNQVLYKPWTPVTINLSSFIGKTIQLEFITSDCTQGGHFGYAYIDVNTNCNGAIAGTTICQGENAITLTAPYGFQTYEWYSNNSFSSLLATTQTLPLNPAPAVGTIIPVIVSPFPGFGCKDTLYATITVAPKPISVAGPDKAACQSMRVQIGGPPTLGYAYQWMPASQVSNEFLSNPLAWNNPPNPQEFIVKTTDILTGCFSFDTTIVTNATVDTSIRYSGTLAFCTGGTSPILSVNGASSAIQWHNGNSVIAGAVLPTYQPTGPGNFWAEVTEGGCMDSTSIIPVSIYPIPIASFIVNKDTGCLSNHSFLFTNNSTVASSSALSYNWKFSDGTNQQIANAVKSFTAKGVYNVELVTTSADGCKDSAASRVYVMPNGTPNFTFDSICTKRPVLFRNLSNENGSTLVNYSWNFNNGGPLITVKDPAAISYSTGGPTTVSLQLTALGCESDPVTITKSIFVNIAGFGVKYPDLTVPQGSSAFIHIRDVPGSTYSWRPQLQLSSYNSRYTEFYATGNDVRYLIDILDKHSCITTDTMLVQVLKKPGFYLPTAFTPNGDGLNDIAKPYLIDMKALKSFSVFNRWGYRLFFSTTYGEGWNGKFNGIPQNPGVYVWILEFFDKTDKLITEKGTITIIQ